MTWCRAVATWPEAASSTFADRTTEPRRHRDGGAQGRGQGSKIGLSEQFA